MTSYAYHFPIPQTSEPFPKLKMDKHDTILLLSIPQVKVEYQHLGNTELVAQGDLDILQAVALTDDDDNLSVVTFMTVGESFVRPLLPISSVWKVGERGFLFPIEPEGGYHRLELNAEGSPSQVEELEDALAFVTTYSRSRYRSSLAFVDSSGKVVGKLDDSVKFVEDVGVSQPKEGDRIGAKAPVILSVNEQAADFEGREVRVNRAGDGLGDSLVNYSAIISESMVKGADVLGHGIVEGSHKLKAHISPNQKPLTFSAETTEKLMRAKNISATAVKVTSKVVETAVQMAVTLGSTILNVAGTVTNKSNPPKSTKGEPGAVKNIFGKFALAIGNVSSGVDRSARILWNASSASTASLVGHRYGTKAGDVTADALGVAENLTLVYFDSKGIARRVVVRRAAAQLIRERAASQRASTGQAVPV